MVLMNKKIAAIVTEYRRHSHADVILTKILEGYYHDGKEFPNLELVSLYCDQTPPKDMATGLAAKHGFTIYDSIEKTLTRGGTKLAVDGVLLIGEHGDYRKNERGQIMYPRRRSFEETAKVLERSNSSVPVFNDKHLSATWGGERWMYDNSNELCVTRTAGW